MAEPTLTDARREIDRYHSEFRNPKLARPEVCDPFRLPEDWKQTYFGSGSAGVYLFLDAGDRVRYVGKSVEMGSRMGAYLMNRDKSRDHHKWKDSDSFGEVRAIVFVKLENSFEAPALEDYLIGRLQPPINKLGKRAEWK